MTRRTIGISLAVLFGLYVLVWAVLLTTGMVHGSHRAPTPRPQVHLGRSSIITCDDAPTISAYLSCVAGN